MLYDEYEAYTKRYQGEFGKRTLVLYECGSFFEVYDDGSGLVDMKEVSELLSIVVSRRNKAILEVSRNNFEMAGFPSHSLKKFLNILLANNYTVVLVTQTTPPPNPKRAVTEILSPGVNLDVHGADSSYLMVVYLEESERYADSGVIDLSIGCSVIDITTGKSDTYETTSYKKDPSYPLDELHRIVSAYSPREVEITSSPGGTTTLARVMEQVDFGRACVHDRLGRMDGCLLKRPFQEGVIKKAFPKTGILSPIEYLNLERMPLALVSYVRMLQFAYIHKENILSEICPPGIIDEHNILLLSYNAAQQLDIVNRDPSKNGSLLNILNNCKTAIGKRYLKRRLMCPYIAPGDITRYHDHIDTMVKEKMERLRMILGRVYDVERLFRRCVVESAHPHELGYLLATLDAVEELKGEFPALCPCAPHVDAGHPRTFCDRVVVVDALAMYNNENLDGGLFQPGCDAGLDELQAQYNASMGVLQAVVDAFNGPNPGYFRLESNDKDGYYISGTSKRFQELVRTGPALLAEGFHTKDFSCKAMASSGRITHPAFDRINHDLVALRARIAKKAEMLYRGLLRSFVQGFRAHVEAAVSTIEVYDFVSTMCYNNALYRLVRPTVATCASGYIRARGVRHPIVEQVQTGIKYVSNDIYLGEEDSKGMLLYGINSAGKSSLMKSIGICVIMVQAGMYVPCDSMEIGPYTKVFTRILSNDDIFRGQSTFTKEIIELRNIMARADSASLVIGDELCSGTESVSAISIVSAGIVHLSRRNTSFVFATHLHDLVNIEEVCALPNLKVYHLSVLYDEEKKRLVYDRKLKPGNGSTLYGIEVCRSLGLPNDFLAQANTIRHRLMGTEEGVFSNRPSPYNNSIYLDTCAVCGGRAEEVHHISEQHKADGGGYIGSFHKNDAHNLVPLCTACHDNTHGSGLKIEGYVQTSDGRDLVVSSPTAGAAASRLPTREQVLAFMAAMSEHQGAPKRTQRSCHEAACKEYGITAYRLKKILNNL